MSSTSDGRDRWACGKPNHLVGQLLRVAAGVFHGLPCGFARTRWRRNERGAVANAVVHAVGHGHKYGVVHTAPFARPRTFQVVVRSLSRMRFDFFGNRAGCMRL